MQKNDMAELIKKILKFRDRPISGGRLIQSASILL